MFLWRVWLAVSLSLWPVPTGLLMTKCDYELREEWIFTDGKMSAGGDGPTIRDWLATKLERVKVDLRCGAWLTLYRHLETGHFWELSYPQSEMHGGGPMLLSRLEISNPDEWHKNV